jgi:V/A-type H+-transporting ATPase subunit E
MEVKLENLIEKLKKEGVEKAQKESEVIVEKAKKEAESIIKEAKKEGERIIQEGKRKSDQFQQSAELALQQAARDSELLVKERLSELFDRVFKQDIAETLTPEFLNELILKILEKWSRKPDVEIMLNKDDIKQVEKYLFSRLKDRVRDSVTLRTTGDLTHGFRIGMKGEDVYYDFSDESIRDMIRMFINPRLNKILGISNG